MTLQNKIKIIPTVILVGLVLKSVQARDPNIFFTFGIPLLVIWSIASNFIKNKFEVEQIVEEEQTTEEDPTSLQPVQPVQPEQVKQAKAEVKVMTLEQVVSYINDKRDDVPHWFCKGGTGSGKSTFIRLALAYRIARGENFVIMTGKRTKVFADVPCIGRDPLRDGSYTVTYNQIQSMCRELLRELHRRDHVPEGQRAFNVINIVIDDASLILSEVEEAFTLVRNVGLLGRELDMRLIIATGSLLVKELGLEGRSDLRDHFAVITYNKRVDGTRETLLRPRYDDVVNIPFDAARVPDLSTRSFIDKTRVWRPVKSQDEELESIQEEQNNKYRVVKSGILMPTNGHYLEDDPDEDGETFSHPTKPTKNVSASESQRNGFRVSLSQRDIAKVAAMIARNEKQTPIIKSMSGYRADHHESFVAEYNRIKDMLDEQ